jgi:hypothetical protein
MFAAIAMWGRNQCMYCIGDEERQAEGYGFVMVSKSVLHMGADYFFSKHVGLIP